MESEAPRATEHTTSRLALLALGVVYGDIGTSPLYALRECFGPHGAPVTHDTVFGVLSLIFWSLSLIVSIKYLAYVLRADNEGEGGILALMALSQSRAPTPRKRRLLLMVGVFGAALLYGDGAITPAISVLSAVEGLSVAAPHLHGVVIPDHDCHPDACCLPFSGAARRCSAWSSARSCSSGSRYWRPWGSPKSLAAPACSRPSTHGTRSDFLINDAAPAFGVLGAVFLVVTGGEALYADLGHFGRRPIRLAWGGS